LWVLCAAATLTQTGVNLLRPVTSYKLLVFGQDTFSVGVATAAYAVVPLLVALWLGKLSDRLVGLRGLLAIGAAALGLGGVALALAPGVWGVLVASAVLGFGHLAFTIAGQSAIARYSAPRHLDAGFGWFTAAFSVGQLLGPVLGGVIVARAGGASDLHAVESALWVGGAVALAGTALFALPLPGEPRDRRGEASAPDAARPGPATPGPAVPAGGPHVGAGPAESGTGGAAEGPGKPTVLAIMTRPGVPAAMFAALSLLSMLDILSAFLPVVGEHLGIGPEVIGALLAIRAAASIACRLGLPAMIARVGRGRLMLACLFCSAASMALPPLVLEAWPGWGGTAVAGVLLAVGGFFLGIGQPLTMTAISRAVPDAWRGSALAVRLMGNRLGQVSMPVLAGLVAAPWGPAGAIWMTCVLLALSGGATWADGRRRGVRWRD